MKTIQAAVNPRLLTKASRFFTGSVTGRILEILQNARRGGATNVEITNHNGVVTVRVVRPGQRNRTAFSFEARRGIRRSGVRSHRTRNTSPDGCAPCSHSN